MDKREKFKNQIEHLQGNVIKDIFVYADVLADLHSVLTSPRGEFFRQRLLQFLGGGLTSAEVDTLRKEFGLQESERHLNKFLNYSLIKSVGVIKKKGYRRTPLGEEAANMIRELERKIGEERAKKIWQASLGKNSIRLFLKVFGSPKISKGRDIIYTPLEIGQISSWLPRTVEAISSIDKLDDAGLVSYLDDGNVHVNPKRSTAFYQYLKNLYSILLKSGDIK